MTEQLYHDYVQSIRSYCDTVWGFSWRNSYYADCIDNIEAIHVSNSTTIVLDGHNDVCTTSDVGRVQHFDRHAGLDSIITPTFAVTVASSGSSGSSKSSGSIGTSSTLPLSDSPASSLSSESQTYNHTSPTSMKSSVATDVWTPLACRKSTTSFNNDITSLTDTPPPMSATSTSPGTVIAPSPASSNHSMATSPQDNKAYCQWCSKSFNGTQYNREYNLKRHMDDIHQQGSRHPCLEPGCEKKFGRADNLRNHRLKVHGIDDPRVRPGNPKRQRKATRRRSRTPPSLTRPETHKR